MFQTAPGKLVEELKSSMMKALSVLNGNDDHVAHTGHIYACVSFSKVTVSLTHVTKSSEHVFSVIFTSFLGDSYPLSVCLSILPIVFGCSLAVVTEVSFNIQGHPRSPSLSNVSSTPNSRVYEAKDIDS
ncbi:hypothetical protein IFM89_032670 [Coptis chinensis]|uniref:Sugar phosphate transporter domain-containing protein n=1 Tax=Coptis chinensis TaxID=261450 RepID=A0A835IDB6_9MAGN|nr:hypothetical protein IFM89_032670 [Coptis chinensis]